MDKLPFLSEPIADLPTRKSEETGDYDYRCQQSDWLFPFTLGK